MGQASCCSNDKVGERVVRQASSRRYAGIALFPVPPCRRVAVEVMAAGKGAGALVVVSGLPAAGKTTLSERLSVDLGMVHICRDRLRAPFMPAWSALPEDQRGPLIGGGIDRLVNQVLGAILASGTAAVLDGNFNWPFQADSLREFVAEQSVPCYEVCLWGDGSVLRQRFIDRDDPTITSDLAAHLDEALARPRRPVFGAPTPTIEIDATDFGSLDAAYAVLLGTLRAWRGK